MLKSRPVTWMARVALAMRWGLRLLLLFLVVDLFYLAVTWPDWQRLTSGPIPKTAFIQEYENEHGQNGRLARAYWQPVALSVIPKTMQRAVIVAEDSRFYEHSGFDLIAFKEAMDYNLNEGRFAVGASTISQQTVKNLFLSSSRTPLRKWHELILTWGMERHLNKRRILEIYLNVVEFGPGIYGVQAASQVYWGIPASQLSPRQAAELAATLPSPIKNNPKTRTLQFEKRTNKIFRLLVRYPGEAAESMAGVPDLPDDETAETASDCVGEGCPVDSAGAVKEDESDGDTGADH
jgi:monofunctional biosynthetic peptidoglycan transglycosylase